MRLTRNFEDNDTNFPKLVKTDSLEAPTWLLRDQLSIHPNPFPFFPPSLSVLFLYEAGAHCSPGCPELIK